jgi:SAM-dependent methyltransferase
MNKRRAALALALASVFVAVAFMVILTAIQRRSGAAAADGPEVTIRNTTSVEVSYELRPLEGRGKTRRRKLSPGAMDRLPAPDSLVLTYKERVLELSFTLTPGRHYAFRPGQKGRVEFWDGSHGVPEAPDLAPFVVTPEEVVMRMLDVARLDKDDLLYDLGCGDGRIVTAAARLYGARGVGIDIEPQRIEESRANAVRMGVEDLVEFRCQDILKADISPATAVTVYLLPEALELIRPKLEAELKPGTPVVSHNYPIPEWVGKAKVISAVTAGDGREHTVFLYYR